ncbi:MAG: CZB domain-containing protein [Aliarcobacter sp.]|nr:CZB domain-containing protein [Aliarcobacter sp.]
MKFSYCIIRVKTVNFEKIGTTSIPWKVTKPTECDLGKWLIEQENTGKVFVNTTNWKQLKQHHDLVHYSVQSYIDEDCKDSPDLNLLTKLSSDLDNATEGVFRTLDQLKKDNIVKKEVVKTIEANTKTDFAKKEINTNQFSKPASKPSVSTNTKTTVVSSKSKDDDEWESF